MNRVLLIGKLTSNPVMRTTKGGQPVCEFSLVTEESFKRKNNEYQKHSEHHKIFVWGKSGEVAQEKLKIGTLIFAEGSIRYNNWGVDIEASKWGEL